MSKGRLGNVFVEAVHEPRHANLFLQLVAYRPDLSLAIFIMANSRFRAFGDQSNGRPAIVPSVCEEKDHEVPRTARDASEMSA